METNQSDTKHGAEKKQDAETFELLVDNREQASPSLFFNWCLSDAAVQRLKKEGIRHPLLFIALRRAKDYSIGHLTWDDCGPWTQRHLVPLQQAAMYLQIRQPGDYQLMANVIWSKTQDDAGLQAAMSNRGGTPFLTYYNGSYKCKLSSCHLGPREEYTSLKERLEHTAEVLIHVDRNLFAQLPAWLTWWCNLMLPNMRDSCAWKQRLPFVFLIQPILIGFWIFLKTALRLIALVGIVLLGPRWKGLSLRPLVHPFTMTIGMLIKEADVAWKKDRHWLFETVCIPLCWIIVPAIGYGLYRTPWSALGNALFSWATLVNVMIPLSLICLFVVICFLLKKNWSRFWEVDETAKKMRQEQIRTQKERYLSRFYTTELQPLVCNTGMGTNPNTSGIQRVPKSHRTVWVRLAAAKASLCKPFAG